MLELEDHYDADASAKDRVRQSFLLTAGGQDDVYLAANQLEARKWLEARSHKVSYKAMGYPVNKLGHCVDMLSP
eukprot:1764407-Amphidinium_carterae.1